MKLPQSYLLTSKRMVNYIYTQLLYILILVCFLIFYPNKSLSLSCDQPGLQSSQRLGESPVSSSGVRFNTSDIVSKLQEVARSSGLSVSANPNNNANLQITSKFRANSDAHIRGAVDIGFRGIMGSKEAKIGFAISFSKALSRKLGPRYLLIVENVIDSNIQENTLIWNGNVQSPPARRSQRRATGDHIHVQPQNVPSDTDSEPQKTVLRPALPATERNQPQNEIPPASSRQDDSKEEPKDKPADQPDTENGTKGEEDERPTPPGDSENSQAEVHLTILILEANDSQVFARPHDPNLGITSSETDRNSVRVIIEKNIHLKFCSPPSFQTPQIIEIAPDGAIDPRQDEEKPLPSIDVLDSSDIPPSGEIDPLPESPEKGEDQDGMPDLPPDLPPDPAEWGTGSGGTSNGGASGGGGGGGCMMTSDGLGRPRCRSFAEIMHDIDRHLNGRDHSRRPTGLDGPSGGSRP